MYSLKYKYYKKPKDNNIASAIKSYSNPYPKTFNVIPTKKRYYSNEKITLISNQTDTDLIVFRLKTGVDQSIYISKNKNAAIHLKANDCLAFYTGYGFLKTKFSHFADNGRLSELYKINSLNDRNSTIIVYPPKEGGIELTTQRKQHDAYNTDKISTQDLDMKPLFIDDLYKDYYNNYYSNN